MEKLKSIVSLVTLNAIAFSSFAFEGLSNEEVAKKLNNPIAAMISAPIQINYDENYGLDEKGSRLMANIQPVIPIELNKDWNVISRTILPVISHDTGNESFSGIGDIVQSVFFSPKAATDNGWIWGAGPVLLLPTASEDNFASDKFGLGPTAVILKQENGWTYGALANHIWSVAGDSDAADVNATFVQPFIGYTWPTATSLFFNSETTYDWERDEKSVPLNLIASQVARVGSQTLSFALGARYWLDSPDGGPEGLGVRFAVTWLIPK